MSAAVISYASEDDQRASGLLDLVSRRLDLRTAVHLGRAVDPIVRAADADAASPSFETRLLTAPIVAPVISPSYLSSAGGKAAASLLIRAAHAGRLGGPQIAPILWRDPSAETLASRAALEAFEAARPRQDWTDWRRHAGKSAIDAELENEIDALGRLIAGSLLARDPEWLEKALARNRVTLSQIQLPKRKPAPPQPAKLGLAAPAPAAERAPPHAAAEPSSAAVAPLAAAAEPAPRARLSGRAFSVEPRLFAPAAPAIPTPNTAEPAPAPSLPEAPMGAGAEPAPVEPPTAFEGPLVFEIAAKDGATQLTRPRPPVLNPPKFRLKPPPRARRRAENAVEPEVVFDATAQQTALPPPVEISAVGRVEALARAARLKGSAPRAVIEGAKVTVSARVRFDGFDDAALRAGAPATVELRLRDPDAAFVIRPLGAPALWVSQGADHAAAAADYEWRFEVSPRRRGRYPLIAEARLGASDLSGDVASASGPELLMEMRVDRDERAFWRRIGRGASVLGVAWLLGMFGGDLLAGVSALLGAAF